MAAACRHEPAACAFVHQMTGEVLFLVLGDRAAETHFSHLADDLRALRVAAGQSSDWLSVPKHRGQVADLEVFVRAWCEENGFVTF